MATAWRALLFCRPCRAWQMRCPHIVAVLHLRTGLSCPHGAASAQLTTACAAVPGEPGHRCVCGSSVGSTTVRVGSTAGLQGPLDRWNSQARLRHAAAQQTAEPQAWRVRAGAPHHGAALETLAEEEGMAPFAKLKPVQAARPVCSSVPASREGSAGSIPEPGTPSALGEALAHMSEDSASSSCSAPAAAFFAQNSTSLAAPAPALASPAWAGNTRPGGLRARPAAGACEPLVEGDQQVREGFALPLERLALASSCM